MMIQRVVLCERITLLLLFSNLLIQIIFVTLDHNVDHNHGRMSYGVGFAEALQVISKSKLEKCEKYSPENGNLNCTRKIVINMAVPSGSSGGEASMVAEVSEVEENSTENMQTLRHPPVITVNKSATFVVYDLTYIRDVAYKPEEYYVQTRKCEPDADARVVKICERVRDEEGHIIEASQPVCCPCGNKRRVPSSCGNFFDKLSKGKRNTAHCLRFPGDWFHVFGIGQRTLGFSIRIQVKTGSEVSEVIIGPENRTAVSSNNFLRVNLVGDFGGYTNVPSFENFFLATPRQYGPGQPPDLGRNFSMWILLERVRFTLEGDECNKIGVGYEAFNRQPDFCSVPYGSCLHDQLWNFIEADNNRLVKNQPPIYGVVGRFQRINEHPGAGPLTFSFGVSEVLNSDLVIELAADDIEYVYQRSPGKILGVTIPTFEALSQFGTAVIRIQNTGEVEASYGLTFLCSKGVTMMEEQFLIMKPGEIATRSFKIVSTTDRALKYACSAILKDSAFAEVDRAECQFTTTSTVLDNGTQGAPFHPPKSGTASFFETLRDIWNKFWSGFSDFITGKSCRRKCSGFFDFRCHIQYVCMSWVIMFALFMSIFPTVLVLLWLLHQKGFFDPLYDWWEDNCWEVDPQYKHTPKHRAQFDHHKHHHHHHHHHHHKGNHHHHHGRHRKHGAGAHHHHHRHDTMHKHKNDGEQGHLLGTHHQQDDHHDQYLHHVHKDKHRHHKHKKERKIIKRTSEFQIYDKDVNETQEGEVS